MVQSFKYYAAKYPDKTAVADSDSSYSYAQLDRMSDVLASHIRMLTSEYGGSFRI